MEKAYETIIQVIKTEERKEERNAVNYYEAVGIAYRNGYYMRKYIDAEIEDVDREIIRHSD